MEQTCATVEDLDTYLIEGQQHFNRDLVKKTTNVSPYFGRNKVPMGTWTLNSGTEHKGHRLLRILPPNEHPDNPSYRPINSTTCETDACDFDPELIYHGSESYTYRLVQRDFQTQWICLQQLAFKQWPQQELDHLIDGLAIVNNYVVNEFMRSRYTSLCENKFMGVSDSTNPADGAINGTLGSPGWVFQKYANGEVNTNYILARLPLADIERISILSSGLFEDAIIGLEREGRIVLDSINMLDVIIPSHTDARTWSRIDNREGDMFALQSAQRLEMLQTALGTQRVVGNFALRYDPNAMKYFPDTDHNASLPAFDANDPATWPRFFRVYPYLEAHGEIGVHHVPNPDYNRAPFGVSVLFNPKVMKVEKMPVIDGYSQARGKPQMFDGTFKWMSPTWDCNLWEDKGFFAARYRMAAQPFDTDLGYAAFHRLETARTLYRACDQLPLSPTFPPESKLPQCCLQGGVLQHPPCDP